MKTSMVAIQAVVCKYIGSLLQSMIDYSRHQLLLQPLRSR